MRSTTVPDSAVRLALLSTPRCGNTWLRHLLAKLCSAEEIAVHHPDDVSWSSLPPRCVLQLHWHRTPDLEAKLAWQGFQAVVLARHPLDVLLSILHFATHDGATRHWLLGEGGDERPLHGAMPCSTSFLQYARGPRASALLSVSQEWWDAPGALTVTYEHLVADPACALDKLSRALGVAPRLPAAEVVAAATLERMRGLSGARHHFWQGNPGHWRRLVVVEVADSIAAAQASAFARFGYACDPDRYLTRSQADACWVDLTREELTEKTWHYLATRRALEKAQAQLAAVEQHLTAAEQAMEATLASAENSLAHGLLSGCRQELALALKAARREEVIEPWKSRFFKLGRSLAQAARRILTRPSNASQLVAGKSHDRAS
jgi:hypothetical protein